MVSVFILILPRMEAGILIFLEDAIALNPVTEISLPMIITAIQAGTVPNPTRQIKAEVISSLSAIGSKS